MQYLGQGFFSYFVTLIRIKEVFFIDLKSRAVEIPVHTARSSGGPLVLPIFVLSQRILSLGCDELSC